MEDVSDDIDSGFKERTTRLSQGEAEVAMHVEVV